MTPAGDFFAEDLAAQPLTGMTLNQAVALGEALDGDRMAMDDRYWQIIAATWGADQ